MRTVVGLLLAVMCLALAGCGGGSEEQALRERVEQLETALASSTSTTVVPPSEVWCSSLEREFSNQQIDAGLREAYPYPGDFVLKAFDMTSESCPSELESNMRLLMWFMNWDNYGNSLPEHWCSEALRHSGFPSLAYLWAFRNFFPDEELFAPVALSWMENTCPDLIRHEEVLLWLVEHGLVKTASDG